MFPLLSAHLTVCAMDRRGRGASGDSPTYSLQKEAEDVAALVESRQGAVAVLGHSYGGVSALEAAFLTKQISKLLLYEPPVQDPIDHNLAVAGQIEELIKKGDPDRAAETFLSEVVQLTPPEVAAMRLRPSWAGLVATVGSQPRQMRALAGYRFDPARMRTLGVPTLLLIGGNTASPYAKQGISSLLASLPNSAVVVLPGQQHNAMDSAREMLAKEILNFLLGPTDARR
jgi:pimeloyl-ACP methyl ester carboxylesterase